MKQPNPKYHFTISIIKSTIRIGAGLALLSGFLPLAGLMLIVAELLGIAEELV